MRRLKNIAGNLEAIFRKREKTQEKTLNLQSLEERILYSAVPLPIDLAEAVVDPQEPAEVGDLDPGSVEANMTSTLDHLDELVADDETPDLCSTVSTESLEGPLADGFENTLDASLDDSAESEFIPRTADTPVAASIVVAVPNDFGQGPAVGSTAVIDEGDVVQILDTSLTPGGIPGQTLELLSLEGAGTLYQEGVALNVGDPVSLTALRSGDVILIPEVDYAGNISIEFERTSGGPSDAPSSYYVNVTVEGTADDGVAVIGDSLIPIDMPVPLASAGIDSTVTALHGDEGGYVVVWTTSEPNVQGRSVVVQRFLENGTPVGMQFTFRGPQGAAEPDVAALEVLEDGSGGGFVIAFRENNSRLANIFLQRFDSSGNPVTISGEPQVDPEPAIAILALEEQTNPSIVATGDGGFGVVYQSVDDGGQLVVELLLFEPNGLSTDPIVVNGSSTFDQETHPEIIELEDGRLLVAWVDKVDGDVQGADKLVATILDPVGNTIVAPFELNSIAPSGDFSIAATPSNGFVVAYDGESGLQSTTSISVFDEDGIEVASAEGVARDSSGRPDIAVLDDGTFVIGVHQELNGQLDVLYQRVFVDALNEIIFVNDTVLLSGDEVAGGNGLVGDQRNIEFAVLNNGRIVSVFNSNGGIVTQQSLQSLTTEETNEVNLEIAPLIFSNFEPIDPNTADGLNNVVLQGLPTDTKILLESTDGSDSTLIATSDGVTDINLNDYRDSIDRIALVAPDNFAGLLQGTLSVTTFHGSDLQTESTEFGVVVTSPTLSDVIRVSGRVAHDIDVDGSIPDDAAGFEGVRVRLLERIDGQTFAVVDDIDTDNGNYHFTGLEEGKQYLVAVDSGTGELSLGNTWAQQTYSSAGGITANFHNDLTSTTAADGFLIGGANAAISDTFSAAVGDTIVLDGTIQHGVFFTASSTNTNLKSVDFGFNFDVVTHVSNNNADAQGSFNQFLINANEIAGENRMRFVPGVPAASGQQWWRIEVDQSLTSIRDDDTIVDGRAWQTPTDGSKGSLVRYDLNPNNANESFIGSVGVDGDKLGDASQVSITALNSPDLEIVNSSGGALPYGLIVQASDANPVVEGVEISNISIHGFGDGDRLAGNIVVDGQGTTSEGIDGDVTGIRITGNVIGADPNLNSPVGVENNGDNILILSASGESETSPNEISNNLIRDAQFDGVNLSTRTDFDATTHWLIADNVILNNGVVGITDGDGVSLGLGTTNISVVGNFISGNADYAIDTERDDGSYLIRSNTITSNGEGTAVSRGGGILLRTQAPSLVVGNAIYENFRNGIDVLGSIFNTSGGSIRTQAFASTENLISMNEFSGNVGVAINLNPSSIDIGNVDDGITLEDGLQLDFGNIGLDAPEIDNVTFANDQLRIEFAASGPLGDANNDGTFDQFVESIEIYVADAGSGDSLGGESYGEGAFYIGAFQTSDLILEDGKWKLTVDRPSFGWPSGNFLDTDSITAISIDASSNTSEFGRNAAINFAPDALPSVTFALEDTLFSFAATDFLFDERNPAEALIYDRIRIDSLPTGAGTLYFDGVEVIVGREIGRDEVDRLTFLGDQDFSDQATFTFSVSDGNEFGNPATMTVDVSPVNDAPTNSAVTLAPVLEDNDRIITEAELLANASDFDGDVLSISGLSIASGNGSLTDNGDGTWTYLSVANDDAAVVFTYDVTDGTDRVAGSATLDILPVNDAPTNSTVTLASIVENSDRVIAEAELLANARDADGDALNVSALTITSGNGTLADNGDGTWTYTPAVDDNSNVIFSYDVTDGRETVAGSATLDVVGANEAPTNFPLTLTSILEDSTRVITEAELLANASDIDGDSLSVSGLSILSGDGVLVDNLDGTWAYTPAADDDTFVVFEYNVSDGTDDVAGIARLDIDPVNDVPTLQQIPAVTVNEGQPLTVDVLSVGMAADIETDTENLTLVILGGADQEWFFVNAQTNQLEMVEGYIVPDGEDTDLEVVVAVDDRRNLNDGVDDTLHQSGPQTVVVRVLNVNDAPVFESPEAQVSVDPDERFVSQLGAIDQDGDEITYSLLEDSADAEFFEIDQATGVLQFREIPDFPFLGTAGESTLIVDVVARDELDAVSEQKSVLVSIPEFAVPLPQTGTTTTDGDASDEANGQDAIDVLGVDSSTLPPAGLQPGQTGGVGATPQPRALVDKRERESGADDFNYTGEGFLFPSADAEIDLGGFASYYSGAGFIEEAELVNQQLADVYASRRGVGNADSDDTQLATLFWQELDSSNEDYLHRNFDADNARLVAASAGLFSAGLLFAVYGGSIAITTLATQIPAWKSLDISPLISAFDEDDESIHEIVDG